ncbi:SDR family NAD(P)-dependent oxidoreductase [Pelagibius sp.]|uniref:SDR family NAD(P)-dependent oxidoreductase n=1 Tax=Pelagibius sp. TaxID=1931238 RepID=UPI003B50A333
MTASFLQPGRVAVVTGAASGIGLAACKRFAELGLKTVLADVEAAALERAADSVAALAAGGAEDVLAVPTDVASEDAIAALAEASYQRFGRCDLLMNNAAVRVSGGASEDLGDWRQTMEVNFWAAVVAERAFLPRMIAQGEPAAIVNTGSKQGITNPPGNTIYNVTKSALKTYTEQLQHRLRNTEGCRVSAHLLVPGWTTTGNREHKPGAWLPAQVIDVMVEALERGDFYIICPDDEVTAETDHKRMLWAAGDIIENRPPLSRWHKDWADRFDQG